MCCGLVEGSGEVLNCMSYIGYMVCEYIASRLHTLLAHLFPLLLNIWEFSCHLHSNNTLRIIQPLHGNNCRSHMSHTYAYTYMVIQRKKNIHNWTREYSCYVHTWNWKTKQRIEYKFWSQKFLCGLKQFWIFMLLFLIVSRFEQILSEHVDKKCIQLHMHINEPWTWVHWLGKWIRETVLYSGIGIKQHVDTCICNATSKYIRLMDLITVHCTSCTDGFGEIVLGMEWERWRYIDRWHRIAYIFIVVSTM